MNQPEDVIIAYISIEDRRKLLKSIDVMDRFVTPQGAIIDGRFPWINFRLIDELKDKNE